MDWKEKPNIILILTDQHRLSAVGSYGETPCQTPNLDKLAKNGVRFETVYTVSPVCSPARATIMTGLYPHSHGICSNIYDLGCSVHEMVDSEELLPRMLEKAGYQCGYTGKWHLGGKWHFDSNLTLFNIPYKSCLPKDVGFQGQNFPGHGGGGYKYPEYVDYLSKNNFSHEVQHPETNLKDPSGKGWPTFGILSGPIESTVSHFLVNHTIDLIDRFTESSKPFFIWHNFWEPHEPYYVLREFYDLYKDVEIPEWQNYRFNSRDIKGPHQVKLHPNIENLRWEDWAEAIRYYYAASTMIDYQIGRLVDYLEKKGLYKNTIIIFTADHGETLGSHGGLIDKGWHHFEEVQRIPLIVNIPQVNTKWIRQPGEILQEWIALVDVYSTILDIAGVDFDKSHIHGKSFIPILQGKQVEWINTAFIEFYGVSNLPTSMITVRRGDIKYGWNCSCMDELYDLRIDPHEMNNIVNDPGYKNQLKEIRQLLADWMLKTQHPSLYMFEFSRMK